MCAKRIEEFTIWQLGVELRRMILAITDQPPFKHDIHFYHQVRGAASSIPANIAEGFGRFSLREFARFVRYARGSAAELETHLRDALERGLILATEHEQATTLCRRISAGSSRLLRYLARAPNEPRLRRRHGSKP